MTEIERLTLDLDEARRWVVQYGQAFERLRAAVAEFESTHEAIQFFADRSPSELAAEAKERQMAETERQNIPTTLAEEKES